MKKIDLELSVGIFILAGLVCLAFLSIKIAKTEVFGGGGYEIHAIFSDTGGLKEGASVVIAGVKVGSVKSITMENYEAKVVLTLPPHVKVQEDAIASIKTKGIIGQKYLAITPGGSEKVINQGGLIRETTPAVDVEELISNYVFGKI
ncbi:outer membrane lipid asymmetry maintenance protein MlaD [Thermodesulfobacteriota bacterium]